MSFVSLTLICSLRGSHAAISVGHHTRFETQRTETARLLDELFHNKLNAIQTSHPAAHALLQARAATLCELSLNIVPRKRN